MRDFDWEILAVLYKTKNITKAAEQLFITQPTLTRRLQQIETELDAVLVMRNNKGISFTPEGEYVSGKAADILKMVQEVREYLAGCRGELSGKLRLGSPNSFMHFIIPALLSEFAARYPAVQVDLHTNLSHELLRSLEIGDLDVCFIRGEHDTFLTKELLSKDQIYLFSKTPVRLDDLPDLPQIEYTKERSIVNASRRWWQEHFDRPPLIRYRVHTGDACMQLVKKGLGYGIFSDGRFYSPEDGLYAYALSFKDGTSFTRNSWLVYNEESLDNPVIDAFTFFAAEEFGRLFSGLSLQLSDLENG